MDTIALVDVYPDEDERVIAKEILRSGGGPAAVAAVALSRLGVRSAIVGTIGDDADGAQVMKIFAREGVDTTGICVGSSPTSGSVIVASRAYNSRAMSTRQPVKQEALNSSAQELMRQAQWIHVDHVGIEQITGAGFIRGNGPFISFDAGYNVEKFDASKVDLFVPTDRQMALRHPTTNLEIALERDAVAGKNIVVATQGPEGSIGFSAQSGLVKASGLSVEVVSTLGAGDVFHGALVAQIIQGYGLQDALERANAVAALSCRGLDGQSMIPTTSELHVYLEAHK